MNNSIITLNINEVFVNSMFQMREMLKENVVKEYAALYKDGRDLNPIVTFHIGEKYHVVDGFHRLEACKLAGIENIQCEVHEGTEREALWYSLGANSKNGLKRSNAEKRKAVTTALMDEEWTINTDAQIADFCGVTQPCVSKLRKKLKSELSLQTNIRIDKNGRTIDTTNIGKSKKKKDLEVNSGDNDIAKEKYVDNSSGHIGLSNENDVSEEKKEEQDTSSDHSVDNVDVFTAVVSSPVEKCVVDLGEKEDVPKETDCEVCQEISKPCLSIDAESKQVIYKTANKLIGNLKKTDNIDEIKKYVIEIVEFLQQYIPQEKYVNKR